MEDNKNQQLQDLLELKKFLKNIDKNGRVFSKTVNSIETFEMLNNKRDGSKKETETKK